MRRRRRKEAKRCRAYVSSLSLSRSLRTPSQTHVPRFDSFQCHNTRNPTTFGFLFILLPHTTCHGRRCRCRNKESTVVTTICRRRRRRRKRRQGRFRRDEPTSCGRWHSESCSGQKERHASFFLLRKGRMQQKECGDLSNER